VLDKIKQQEQTDLHTDWHIILVHLCNNTFVTCFDTKCHPGQG